MAHDTRNLVVLGGSYGGISAAHYLLKHITSALSPLGKGPYQVVLVSPSDQVLCRPATPRALISDSLLNQDKLFVDIRSQFKEYPEADFTFIQAKATKLNHEERSVTVESSMQENDDSRQTRNIPFHALVIATGASTPSPLLSMNHDATHLRASWSAFRDALPRAKNIVIAGGGPSGIEVAAELGEHLNGRPGFMSSIKPARARITVVAGASSILPVLRASISREAESYLGKLGITVLKRTRVIGAVPAVSAGERLVQNIVKDEEGDSVADKTIVSLDNGETLEADLYIPAAGMVYNTSFVDPSLLTEDGRVEVQMADGERGKGSTLRVVEKAGPRIYAVGDVSSYARPAVHNVINAVPVLGANMKKDLLEADQQEQGKDGDTTKEKSAGAITDRLFEEDTREMQLVPLGTGKGVGAAMGYRVPSLLVWLIKGRDYWLWSVGYLWSGRMWAKES